MGFQTTVKHYIQAQSMSGSFNGSAFAKGKHSKYCVHCVWTGTPTGTIKIQESNNIDFPATTADWVDVSGATLSPAGSASSGIIQVTDSASAYFRVVYTASSGTGTMNGFASVVTS